MLRNILLTTAAASLIAVPAWAGDAMKSQRDTLETTMDGRTQTTIDTPARPAVTSVFLTEPASGDMSADRLIGTQVVNHRHEQIGSIDDLVVSSDRGLVAAVISVGGFLGVGDKHIAVDTGAISFTETNDETIVAMVDMTKGELEAAPTFEIEDGSLFGSMQSMLHTK